MAKISEPQAQAAFAWIKAQWAPYLRTGWPSPLLVEEHDWGAADHDGVYPWGILWEEGPEDWALSAGPGGQASAEAVPDWPEGVYLEAANSWSVRLWPV